MLPTYEAIYEGGRLQWLGEAPASGRHRVLVTVLEGASARDETATAVAQVLEATRGAWGRSRSLDAIDAELEQHRAEWDLDASKPEEETRG